MSLIFEPEAPELSCDGCREREQMIAELKQQVEKLSKGRPKPRRYGFDNSRPQPNTVDYENLAF